MSAKSVSSICPYCSEEVEFDKHIVHEYNRAYDEETQKYSKVVINVYPCVWIYERTNNFNRLPRKVHSDPTPEKDDPEGEE